MEKKHQSFRFLSMILIVVLMGVGFVACSEDDDNNSNIVGKWICTNKYRDTPYWVFNSNGTGYAMDYYGDQMPFSYKLKGTTITVAWDDDWDDPDVWIIVLSDNTLTLYYDDGEVDWTFEKTEEETVEASTGESNSFKSSKVVDICLPSDIKCSQYQL